MPIAELNALYATSLLGERISITPSGTDLILTWSGGTLQQADAVTGPFTDVPGARSPYTYTPDPSAAMKYFRVKLQ